MKNDKQKLNLQRVPAIFGEFFKISAITVGGGLTMIPVMEQEFAEKRHWLTENDVTDTLALVQSMPGIIAVNMAIVMGYRMAGLPGVAAAVAGVVIPPFLAILVIAYGFSTIAGNQMTNCIFRAVRAAVCALILLSAIKMGKQLLKRKMPVVIAILAFAVFLFFPQVNAVLVIVAAGLTGLLTGNPENDDKEGKLP